MLNMIYDCLRIVFKNRFLFFKIKDIKNIFDNKNCLLFFVFTFTYFPILRNNYIIM